MSVETLNYSVAINKITLFNALQVIVPADKALLTPGKATLTLHHCVELGVMPIHNGQLPSPH